MTYHFFREPEIRFRVRLTSAKTEAAERKALFRIADSLKRKKLVAEWHFGNHGEKGVIYRGERDRYGKNGWKSGRRNSTTGRKRPWAYFPSSAAPASRILCGPGASEIRGKVAAGTRGGKGRTTR